NVIDLRRVKSRDALLHHPIAVGEFHVLSFQTVWRVGIRRQGPELPRTTRRQGSNIWGADFFSVSSCSIKSSTPNRPNSALGGSNVVRGGIIISEARAEETMATSEKSSGICQPRPEIACMMPGSVRSFIAMSAV